LALRYPCVIVARCNNKIWGSTMTDFNMPGIQTVTIGPSGTYDIAADGAQGGSGIGNVGGAGAAVSGDVYLQAGTKLEIVVGGEGGNWVIGGGGDGSFVIEIYNGTATVDTILAVPGGGAGSYGIGGGGRAGPTGGNGYTTEGAGAGGVAGAAGQGGGGAPGLSAYGGARIRGIRRGPRDPGVAIARQGRLPPDSRRSKSEVRRPYPIDPGDMVGSGQARCEV
jgi:hypothetical protein